MEENNDSSTCVCSQSEMQHQDQNLEKMGETVGTLKVLGQEIGRELDEHNVYVPPSYKF